MEPYFYIGTLVFVIVGGAVIAIVASYRAEKRRTELLAQIAAEMGFEFEPAGGLLVTSGLQDLPTFTRGHSRKTRNVMRKVVQGSDVALMDHQYTIGSGKNQHTVRLTSAVFRPSRNDVFPDFELRPESIWHRLGSFFGYQDIDFDSHPSFSRNYLLRGSNEEAIRELFTPQLLDSLERTSGKWCIETRSNWIAVHQGKRVQPKDVRQFLTDATKVYLLFVPAGGGRGA